MPPTPSTPTISNGPIRVPVARVIWKFRNLVCNSALERGAIPVRQFRRRFIRALAKIENRRFRRRRGAHVVVSQNEFAQLRIPMSGIRSNGFGSESFRSGRRIRIERGVRKPAISRPESATAHLVRVGFFGHGIRVRIVRSAAPRESRHGKIERSPEKVHRAAFPDETGPELFQDAIGVHENATKGLYLSSIVRSMVLVDIMRSRVVKLRRLEID